MINCEKLYNSFKKEEIDFFTGVPDSTFKDWMKYLADNHNKKLTNIIASNECEAVAIASGYHLATGKVGVVYLQNSGLGKTVNPITSLADPEVYSIPMLLMIGWRGEPGKKDEPQHKKMGRITLPLLDTLEIPYFELPENQTEAEDLISKVKSKTITQNRPYALIIKKGLFETYEQKNKTLQDYEMDREEAIKTTINELSGNEVIVSTTGKTSRELFEYRKEKQQSHQNDFLTVGAMGCSASIALGIALNQKEKQVYVFDGDGAVIMQEGTLSTIGNYSPRNLYHIVFDNESYDSTGGQPTTSTTVNFEKLALANNYLSAKTVQTKEELTYAVKEMKEKEGPQMLIVKVNKGARKDLGRPTTTPIENKKSFITFLGK
jgi:phosphonopyruvate decarboxylase